MKLSFTTTATPDLDHKGAIELAQRFGFQGTDIRYNHFHSEITKEMTDEDIKNIAMDFKHAGTVIPGLQCYRIIINKTPEVWDIMKKELQGALHTAGLLGAALVRIPGGHAKKGESTDEFTSKAANVLQEVLQEDTTGIEVAVQNHAGSLNARESVQLAEKVNNPRFGVVFSPDHCIISSEENFDEILELVFPWTKELYIADTILKEEGKHEGVYPGKGQVPLKQTIAFFQKNNFPGYYTFKWEKIWQPQLEDAEVVLPKFIEFMEGS